MISVLVPYRPGDPQHDRNWDWTRRRWLALMPGAEMIVCSDDRTAGASTAEFNHPLALNRCAALAGGEIYVIADIDIVPDPFWIERAIACVEKELAPWVVAERYCKLDRLSTERILARDPASRLANGLDYEEPPITASCAPPVVISREGFEAAGGYDERIAWWGADDGVFRICADTFWGDMQRVRGDALHLWHERTEALHPHQQAQHDLVFDYMAAAGNPEAVGEVRYG